jgi:hypothetical protein
VFEETEGMLLPHLPRNSPCTHSFIGFNTSPATFFVTSGTQPEILTVDAASGNVTTRVPLAEQKFVLGFSYDVSASSALGIFANYSGPPDVFLARVDARSGGLRVLNATLPFSRLLPCEATLIPEHEWLLLLNADGDRDDADDTWEVLDVSTAGAGRSVFSGPWSYKAHGGINAFISLPDACAGGAGPRADAAASGLLALAKKEDDAGPTLVWISFASAGADVTALHTWSNASYTDVVATLGSATIAQLPGGSCVLYQLARDMGSEQALLLSVSLAPAGTGAAVPVAITGSSLIMLDEDGVAGDVYGLRWAP